MGVLHVPRQNRQPCCFYSDRLGISRRCAQYAEVDRSRQSSGNHRRARTAEQAATAAGAVNGRGPPGVTARSATLPMTENAYDFNNIDGIPGFGTLPPAYDSKPVMPRIGSP